MPRVAIIGGGLSGLSTAWNLQKNSNDIDITLFESEERLGGKIRSRRENGFLYEYGPNGFMDSRQEMVDLCNELGLQDRTIQSNDEAAERFILKDQKLMRLPHKPPQIITSNFLPLLARLRLLTEPFRSKCKDEDESLYDFAKRRFGPYIADFLVDPFTTGVFGADCRQLSVRSAVPALWKMEQEYGSIFKAMKAKMKNAPKKKAGKLTSFKNGMEEMIIALHKQLKNKITIHMGTSCNLLTREENKYSINYSNASVSQQEVYDCVILTCPSYVSAKILKSVFPELATKISSISYSAMCVTAQGYSHPSPEVLNGFGYLVPSSQPAPILGTLFSSSIYKHRAPENSFSLRTMQGGGKNPEVLNLNDDEILQLILRENQRTLGIDYQPDFKRVIRWPKAIPRYEKGHWKIVQEIEDCTKNEALFISGNAFYGVSMNDCVTTAAKTAKLVKNFLEN